jgi:hypothetical protein
MTPLISKPYVHPSNTMDIPILTIHDSFITTSHNKHRLKEIMGQAYRDTTKYKEAKIKIKCTIKGKEETKETI